MSQTILFRMFPQESHHNATFSLAKEMQKKGFRIVYASIESMKKVVLENGFDHYTVQDQDDIIKKPLSFKIGGSWLKNNQAIALIREFKKIKKIRNIDDKNIVSKDYFKEVIQDLNPNLIFVDEMYKCNMLHIMKYKIPFASVETTVSLFRNLDKPPLNSTLIPKKNQISKFRAWCAWKYYDFLTFTTSLLLPAPKKSVISLSKRVGYPLKSLDFGYYTSIGFNAIPEVNTTIFEFDFPHAKKSNHFYAGFPELIKRKDSLYDYDYSKNIDAILASGKKVVYCSFGSMAWRYANYHKFLKKILKSFASNEDRILLMCVEDDNVRRDFRTTFNRKNIYIFRRVPQVDLLNCNIDLMITHGGVNSITECIGTNTPMLVYPGSKHIDQIGNAARVVYHEIGLRGTYSDSVSTITTKCSKILQNRSFKGNLVAFNEKVERSSAYSDVDAIVDGVKKAAKAMHNERLLVTS